MYDITLANTAAPSNGTNKRLMPRLAMCLTCLRVRAILQTPEEKRRRSSSPTQCHLTTPLSHSLRNWGNFVFSHTQYEAGSFCSCYRGGWIPFKAVRVSSTRGPEVDRGDLRWNVNKARQERLASNEQRGPMVPTEAGMAAPWDSCVRAHTMLNTFLYTSFFFFLQPFLTHKTFFTLRKNPMAHGRPKILIKWHFLD